jgi:hypothetical protein
MAPDTNAFSGGDNKNGKPYGEPPVRPQEATDPMSALAMPKYGPNIKPIIVANKAAGDIVKLGMPGIGIGGINMLMAA